MQTLIRGKYLFTDFRAKQKGILQDSALCVQDGVIKEIGSFPALKEKYPQATVLGTGREFVLPGFIDAHTHGHGLSHIQRGVPFDFLENSLLDWAYAPDLPPELNAQLTAARHLLQGCTMLHHNEMGQPQDNLEKLLPKSHAYLQGYLKSGMRIAYSPGIRNINFLASEDEAFYYTLPSALQERIKPLVFFDRKQVEENYFTWFQEIYQQYQQERIAIFMGPNWAHGATDELLQKAHAISQSYDGLPMHIHTLQTPYQKAYGLRQYGKSLLAHLDDLGLVDERLVLGHAVYLTESDIALLAEKKAAVTHHPSCNLAMRNGIAPLYALWQQGVTVALGLDEKGINDNEDPIMELRMIHYLHRVSGFDLAHTPPIDPYDILAMGTINAAKVLGVDHLVGSLEPGKRADLIIVDGQEIENAPYANPDLDIALLFLHRAQGHMVKHVMVDGKLLVKDRVLQNVDLSALYQEARNIMQKGLPVAQREYADLLHTIKPYYQNWYANWLKQAGEPYYQMNAKQ